MEAGVLDRRRLEPRERLPPLLVLLGDPLADVHAGADHDGLHADDHEVEGPRLGRLRQPDDEAVHEDRRGAHPDDRERERPQVRSVEEAADHEDEEDRLAEHEDRCEDQHAHEEHAHAHAVVPPRLRHPREEDVDPAAAATAMARAVSRSSCSRSFEEPRIVATASRTYPQRATSVSPKRSNAGFVVTLMAQRYSTAGRRTDGAGGRPVTPTGTAARPASPRRRSARPCPGAVPAAARSPSTRPGGPARRGREVADPDQGVGQHPRQVDAAQEHHHEEHRDGDGRCRPVRRGEPPRPGARWRRARSCQGGTRGVADRLGQRHVERDVRDESSSTRLTTERTM